jgi:trk system potassium uptake protein TrkA
MGAGLAELLSERGHRLCMVDRSPGAFQLLGTWFRGERIEGTAMDRDILVKSGIERVDGLAVVTGSDETNAVVARIAREVFRVPKVVVRLYDSVKGEIYRRLGLQVITPHVWEVRRVAEMLAFSQLDSVTSLGNGEVVIIDAEVPGVMVGRRIRDFTMPGEVQPFAVLRKGSAFIPGPETTLRSGDRVRLAVTPGAMQRLEAMFSAG